MNLKGFKKVHEDEHKAVLKNEHGHEITIAKKALTDRHRKDLEGLTLHADEGMEVPSQDSSVEDALNRQSDIKNQAMTSDESPQNDSGAPPQSNGLAQQQAAPTQQQAQRAPSNSLQNTGVPSDLPSSDQYQQQQVAKAQQESEQSYQQYYQDHAKEIGEQNAKFAQDLVNGHIQPQTYNSLFAKKDTVGKIGTLFGLLVSGAGSGLSHQPNAVLGMMDKEINNDLEAQKQSKLNAQNFLRINQAAEMNKANVGLLKAQTQGANIENQIKHVTLTKNQMLLSTLHGLNLGADKIPANSPLKQQYSQMLNGLSSVVGNEVQQNSMKAAAQMAGISQAQYVDQTNKMRMAGEMLGEPGLAQESKDRESKTIPGVGYTDLPVTDKDREGISIRQNLLKKAQDLRQWSQKNSGSLNPATRAEGETKARLLQDAYRQANGEGVFRKGESDFISGIIDSEPTKFLNKYRVDPKFGALEQSIKSDVGSITGKYTTHNFSDTQESNGSSGEEERYDPKSKRTVVFDSKTKKPLRFK